MNKIKIDILKDKNYTNLLIEIFDMASCFEICTKLPKNLEEEFLSFHSKDLKNYNLLDAHFEVMETYKNISWLYIIDGIHIGVFKEKYMVSFNESELDFEFNGDSESNWIEHNFGWAVKDTPKFQEECFKRFGVPITTYDPYQERSDI